MSYPQIMQRISDVTQFLNNSPTVTLSGPSRQPRLVSLQGIFDGENQFIRVINCTSSGQIILDISTVGTNQQLLIICSAGNGAVSVSASDDSDVAGVKTLVIGAGSAAILIWSGSEFIVNN